MINKTSYLVIIFVIANSLCQCSKNSVCRDILDKKTLNFTQIADKFGYAVNEYDITTQDSYILKLFNIPGDKRRPVLLMHGIIDSADTFIIRGNTSLAITLARAGYDVWVGNTRGNRYARRHVYLDPDRDEEFWDFSFHEAGLYDLPAIIDYILINTSQTSLSALGHSQGNTIFLVLGATRPDYNEKVKILVSLSPVCFLNNLKNVAALLLRSAAVLNQLYSITGQEELLGDDTSLCRIFRTVCGCKDSYKLCAHGVFFALAGSDPEELEPEFFPTVIAHYPTGTSRKSAIHFAQIGMSKTFSEFDYQWRNQDVYNSSVPPEYDLSKVNMRIALWAGRNDQIATMRDVELLRNKLPNVVEYKVLNHKRFNHIDGVWGRNMNRYLFPDILKVFKIYS